jgi:hypothetical protein
MRHGRGLTARHVQQHAQKAVGDDTAHPKSLCPPPHLTRTSGTLCTSQAPVPEHIKAAAARSASAAALRGPHEAALASTQEPSALLAAYLAYIQVRRVHACALESCMGERGLSECVQTLLASDVGVACTDLLCEF